MQISSGDKFTEISKMPKVVAVGGGTGLPVVLRGFKSYPVDLTAIVTVTDDGGSSGRLRGELGVIPPGDIRNCLLALANTEPLMQELFNYRFQTGSELNGHNLGNLLIAAVCDRFGPEEGLYYLGRILSLRGKVLPLTSDNILLEALFSDGKCIIGETSIVAYPGLISNLMLKPADPKPFPGVVEAIASADILVLGPGSLYTSIIPHLLVPEVKDAIQSCRGTKYYISNVMTQPGETDDFTAADHVRQILHYGGRKAIDKVVINTDSSFPAEQLQVYSESGSLPVETDQKKLADLGTAVLEGAIINVHPLIRHSAEELARLIWHDYSIGIDKSKEESACRTLPR